MRVSCYIEKSMIPVRVIRHRQSVLRLNFSFSKRINIVYFTPLSRVGF